MNGEGPTHPVYSNGWVCQPSLSLRLQVPRGFLYLLFYVFFSPVLVHVFMVWHVTSVSVDSIPVVQEGCAGEEIASDM